jgi:hypothetical protein
MNCRQRGSNPEAILRRLLQIVNVSTLNERATDDNPSPN